MEKERIYLSPPHMSGNEIKYLQSAIESNWITQGGPHVDVFEGLLEDYLGDGVKVAATTSGTAAIHLALQILGVGKGDFVICQSLTFVASANPIIYLGANPVFVDSETDTWNICPKALEDAIKYCANLGKKPKAIIAVALYGMPYKIDEVAHVSRKYEIPVIEDSAEALGSTYKGKKLGTFGDLSIISFNGNKIITTSGGGALVSKAIKIKERALFLATQAKENCPYYEHKEVGYNYRMSNVAAGIGCGQMEVLEKRIIQRRENHKFYNRLLENVPGIDVFKEPNSDCCSNHWLTVILIHDKNPYGINTETLRQIFLDKNIEARPVWKPMHLQPVFSNMLFFGGKVAERLFMRGLCLPSGSNLANADKERISEVVKHIFY